LLQWPRAVFFCKVTPTTVIYAKLHAVTVHVALPCSVTVGVQ
jgi:hypothetical protein